MSLLICGDTHGDYDIPKLSRDNLRRNVPAYPHEITHLIICGDWGAIWSGAAHRIEEERELLAFYDAMPWETLVVLGNHEGYDRIAELPWTTRHGAPVQEVTEKIFILQHGNVYTIEGKRFFVFGGGESLDRDRRVEGESWWPQEIPTQADLEWGLASLKAAGGHVDYVLTHTCPQPMAHHMVSVAPNEYKVGTWTGKGADVTVGMLTELQKHMKPPKAWYFGHYHVDHTWKHYRCLYHELALIGEDD